MPGILSTLFSDDQDGGASGSSQSQQAQVDQGLDISPTVSVETDMGGSYQNLDGSTTTWENDNDVTLATDVDATLGAVLGTEENSFQEG